MFHSRLTRKKATVSRVTERASVVRKMGADANTAATATVIGLRNEMIARYPAFTLKKTATMLREFVDGWDRLFAAVMQETQAT